jgi:putative transposase
MSTPGFHQVADTLTQRWPEAAEVLETAETDLCAYTAFPRSHWRNIASTPPSNASTKR